MTQSIIKGIRLPHTRLAQEKVKFTALFLAVFSGFSTDFLIFQQNRIVAGQGISIIDIFPVYTALLLFLFFMTVLIPSNQQSAFKGGFTVFAATCFIVALTVLAGRHAINGFVPEKPYARFSLGAGFWLMIFSGGLLLTDAFLKSSRRSRFRPFIVLIPLSLVVIILTSGIMDQISLFKEFSNRRERFIAETITHLTLAFSSVGIAAAIGIPLGIFLAKRPSFSPGSFFFLNTVQTIPCIALFGLLISPLAYLSHRFPWLQEIGFLGIGWAPAVIALLLYSLLPIVRNTYIGLKEIDPAVIEAARGMGLNRWQLLIQVEIPLVSTVILSGFRIAAVQCIGNTAVAALIGAGGLGIFIFQGLGQAATSLILLGAIPTILIAVLTDTLLQLLITLTQPTKTS